MAETEVIQLRPHHSLCTRFFEGKGYSGAFTLHMEEIIRRLENGARVQLVKGADAVCGSCPNMCRERCTAQEKVMRYDAGVLARTGLLYGQVLDYEALCALVTERIIEPDVMAQICGDCSWSGICLHKPLFPARFPE